MAGIFKETRQLVNPYKGKGVYVNTVTGARTNFDGSLPILNQSTTSFRSGGRYGQQIDDARQLFKEQAHTFDQPFDTGHEFFSTKQGYTLSHREVFIPNVSGTGFYRGPIWGSVAFPDIPKLDLTVFGTKAINATKPDRPTTSLGVSIAEFISEGIPRLAGKGAFTPNTSLFERGGSEYLGHVFGTVPFVSQIVELVYAIQSANKIIDQFIRDSERVVRRRMNFDPIIETDTPINRVIQNQVSLPHGVSTGTTTLLGQKTSLTRTVTTTLRRDIWFSGAYTYFLHEKGFDPFDKLTYYTKLANKVAGTSFTADVAYNLVPWSWMFDWFTDFGDVLSNAVSFNQNNVLLRYGYLMCHTTYDYHMMYEDAAFTNYNGGKSFSMWTNARSEQKERIRATPFGFGFNPGTLNAQQWAILAALGMTKGPNLLR